MNVIDWLMFSRMLPFMLFGLFVHIFGKFVLAHKKPGYSFLRFVDRNIYAWILSLLYCIIGCYLFVRGMNIIQGASWDIAALFMGISGGSLGKTTIKIFTPKMGSK